MSQWPALRAAIKSVQLHQGLYLCIDSEGPAGNMVPVVSLGGKIYAIKLDQELTPAGFCKTVSFKGPFTPESTITN